MRKDQIKLVMTVYVGKVKKIICDFVGVRRKKEEREESFIDCPRKSKLLSTLQEKN